MKRLIIILLVLLSFIQADAQFPGTDSLRNYNNIWITNNAARAFTNYRLHTLLAGMIDWIDSARAGVGGTIGVDSIGVLNDSTFRYRKNGVFQSVVIKGGAVQHDITLTGTGLSGSHLKVDTTILKTVADAQRVTDSLVALLALKLNISDTAAMMQPLYDYIASDTIHIYTAADPDPDTLYSYKNGDSTLVGYIPKGVTSISQGYGITNSPNPITSTGTVEVDTTVIATQYDISQVNQSWNQTLTVNDTTHGDLNFDTLVTVPSPGSFQKYWMRFQPLAKGEGSPPFLWTQNAQHYSGVGQADNTMAWGWNISAGGGAEIAGQPGVGFSLEQRYIPVVGDTNTEAHLFYITTLGQQKRLFSYTIKEYLNSYDFYHTTSNFYIKQPSTDSVWYSMIPKQQVWYARGPTGSASYSFFGDANAVSISRSGGALIGTEFMLVNFNTARFPGSTILENPTTKSVQLTFRGNSTDVGTIIFDSTKTIINALTNVPIRLNSNNQTSAEIQSGKINLLKPTTIGANTTPAAQLDVRDNATTYTRVLYVEQTATSGNRFGGIITAVGSGASTNTGLNLTANNGTTNRALRIDGPAAGANNHAIYSEATAQSYFAGNLGLGVTSPASLIHGIKTTEQLRLGYDASNYLSTTINSTGSATLNLVGTTPEFTFSDAVNVPDEAYGAGWDGNTEVPTKNAIYDKIESLPTNITSINSQTGPNQTLAAGTWMGIVSGSNNHTYSVNTTLVRADVDSRVKDSTGYYTATVITSDATPTDMFFFAVPTGQLTTVIAQCNAIRTADAEGGYIGYKSNNLIKHAGGGISTSTVRSILADEYTAGASALSTATFTIQADGTTGGKITFTGEAGTGIKCQCRIQLNYVNAGL